MVYTYFDLIGWQYSTEFFAEAGAQYALYGYTPGTGWTALTNIITGNDSNIEVFSPLFDFIWQIPPFVVLTKLGQPLGGAKITDDQGNTLADLTVSPGGTVNASVEIPLGSLGVSISAKDILGNILSGQAPVQWSINGLPVPLSGSIDILNLGVWVIIFGWGDGITTTIDLDVDAPSNPFLWETNNPSNRIFNATPKDDPWGGAGYSGNENGAPRNVLYLVPNPSNNLYQATLQLDIQPASLRTEYRVAAYWGETTVAGSDTAFNSQSVAALEFAHPVNASPVQSLTLWVGHDDNENGELDFNERRKVFVYDPATEENVGLLTIRGTDSAKYNYYNGLIASALDGLLSYLIDKPHSVALLRIFRDGGLDPDFPLDKLPNGQTPASLDAFGGYFSEWLTHNSGAPFDGYGVANITDYIWDNTVVGEPTISLCDLLADSSLIEDAVTSHYNSSVASDVASHFAGLPVGSEAAFPSSTGWYDMEHTHLSAQQGRPWVPETTVDFFEVASDDIGNTLGRSRILSHRARYVVVKQTGGLVVTEVETDGEAIDLYDFNHEVLGTVESTQAAAALQIGYANGSYGAARDQGKIFRNRIKFKKTYPGLP